MGRTPTVHDINLNKDGPSKLKIVAVFGSYEEALSAAGLPPLKRPWREWGDDELIELLLDWYKNHPGSTMTYSLVRMNPDLPSLDIIRQRFGNVKNWHEAAGIDYTEPISYWRNATV